MAAGTDPLPSGNPYDGYVGSPPNDSFPAWSAQDLNGYPSPSYQPASDPNGYRSPSYHPASDPNGYRSPSYHPASDPNGYRSPSYHPASDPNGYRSPSYHPASDPNGYRSPSYHPASDPNGHRAGWYPRHSVSPPTGDDGAGAGSDMVGFETRGPGRRGDGHYYPAAYSAGGYPVGRHGHQDYLPGPGYPGAPAAQHSRDPYAQDGYGGQPGYEPLGR